MGLFRRIQAQPHRLEDGLRVYAVGDIHGRFDLLRALERRIWQHERDAPPAERSMVVFLGDYIDRGDSSYSVIERMSWPGFAGIEARHLMGNHEDAMLAFLDDPLPHAAWLSYGGQETLESYGVALQSIDDPNAVIAMRDALASALPAHHLMFLQGLELMVVLGDYAFVHAGIRPDVPLDAQTRDDLLMIRNPFLKNRKRSSHRIVHGHTIMDAAQFLPNRISLDTGAYATGNLSCAVIEADDATLLP